MKQTRPPLPNNFLWGLAGSAHQIEGGNVNSDCWVMERMPGSPFHEPAVDACDHYHRFAEDIALIASLGFNSYRFSLDWARIEPDPGVFSTAALDHYRRMLAACHDHALTPVVTFHHFTSPRWFAAAGGFERPDNGSIFVRYCDRAAAALGDLIPIAATFNEINIGLVTQALGLLPDDAALAALPARAAAARAIGADDFSMFPFCPQHSAPDIMMAAHRPAVDAIRSHAPSAQVGMTLAVQDIVPGPGGEARCAAIVERVLGRFLPLLDGDDYVGAQIYTRVAIGPDGPLPPAPGAEMTLAGQEFVPEATEGALMAVASRSGLPILITENGVAVADDARRVAFIDRALAGVARAMDRGAEVIGYMHWSVFDNFEWHMGYGPGYGVIAVDRTTFARTPKPSAAHLGAIARANVLPGAR